MSMREYGVALGSRIRPWLTALAEFGRWWWDELQELIPQRWQRNLRQLGNSLIIELDEQQARLGSGNLNSLEPIQQVALDQLLSAQPWPSEATLARADKAGQIILLLPERDALRKVVSLPAATEGRLENVLRFEMDRYTPFTGDQVYFGYRQLRSAPSRERLEVELVVVPRVYLDPLLEALGQVQLRPNSVSLRASADATGNLINLLPTQRGQRGGTGWKNRRLSAALIATAVALLLIAPFIQQQQQLRQLRHEVEQLKTKAERARGLGSSLEELQSNRDFLLRQQTIAPRLLLLLDELTALLPDHTWLTRLENNGDSLRLDGESGAASALISLLEGSPTLENVRFASPITATPGTSRERFSLTADLTSSEAPR